MTHDTGAVNQQLLLLADRYLHQSLPLEDYRRLRRRLVCEWTGEKEPELLSDMDATQPVDPLEIIIDEPKRGAQTATVLLVLGVAMVAAGALLFFIFR